MQPSFFHRLFWGIVLVGAGIAFLLNQIGLATIDIGQLFANFWPVLLMLIGLQGMLLQRSGGYVWNVILVLVGAAFLGRNLGFVEWEWHNLFGLIGPIALILFGIGMITRGGRCKGRRGCEDPQGYGWNPVTPPPAPERPETPLGPPPAPPLADDPNASFTGAAGSPPPAGGPAGANFSPPGSGDRVPPNGPHFHDPGCGFRDREERRRQRWEERQRRRDFRHYDPNAHHHCRFIGDVHIGQDYWELRPMNISHFIGDTTLDLTKAQIPAGETKIYVSCFIGDVKVFVPNDPGIGVQVVSSSLIGDVRVWDHKRGGFFNQMSVETPGYPDSEKRVFLIASAFIGDVRVTKVG